MKHELTFKESTPDSRMVIPSEVLEASGISVDQCVELHQLRHCVVKSKFVCKFKTCTMHGVPKQRLVVSTDQRQCV